MKDTPTPRTDELEALRDAMLTRASADYFAALQLCDKLERELTAVTEQRDRLAEALERILDYQGRFAEEEPESIAKEALKSIVPNK
jgi:MoxR-like ATPase